jgi:hypothetical protein
VACLRLTLDGRSGRPLTHSPPSTRKCHPKELNHAAEGSRLRAKWGSRLRAI